VRLIQYLCIHRKEIPFAYQRYEIELKSFSRRLYAEAYVGHAAWSPGQLDNELRLNAWVVAPLGDEVESLGEELLWRRWLGRIRPDLRLFAEGPGDLGLN
jgi:putative AlgH/UPF0301 family transcriptional regulator